MKMRQMKARPWISLLSAALLLSGCAVPAAPAAPGSNSAATSAATPADAVAKTTPTAGPTSTVVSVAAPENAATATPATAPITSTDSAADASTATPTSIDATVPPSDTGKMIIKPAQVEALDVQVLESKPVQVKATVKGTLGDGCTTLNAIDQKREGNEFKIEVTTKRPADTMCTMIAKMFEESVSLDVAGLKAGDYIVSAGTLSQTFTLAADN